MKFLFFVWRFCVVRRFAFGFVSSFLFFLFLLCGGILSLGAMILFVFSLWKILCTERERGRKGKMPLCPPLSLFNQSMAIRDTTMVAIDFSFALSPFWVSGLGARFCAGGARPIVFKASAAMVPGNEPRASISRGRGIGTRTSYLPLFAGRLACPLSIPAAPVCSASFDNILELLVHVRTEHQILGAPSRRVLSAHALGSPF